MPEEIAKHETEEWFKSMKVKRLGPSFIPAEILVPLEKMDNAFEEIGKKIKLPVLTEGMVINDGNVVLLCFMRHSERSILFNTAFALSSKHFENCRRKRREELTPQGFSLPPREKGFLGSGFLKSKP